MSMDETLPADASDLVTENEAETKEIDEVFADLACQDEDALDDPSIALITDVMETVDPKMTSSGWSFDAAKSINFGRYDQSMKSHVYSGIYVILRLNDALPDRAQLPREELRNCIGMWIIHDIHKLLRDPADEEQFNITRDTVREFADALGVSEFAPDLSDGDLHSAAVALHEADDRKKDGDVTERFLRLSPHLRTADSCASMPKPERVRFDKNDERSEWLERLVRDAALDQSYSVHYHALTHWAGSLTPVLNAAVKNVLEDDYGLHLLEVYQDGCTYIGDGDSTTPPTMAEDADTETITEFLDAVYDQFLSELQGTYQAYRNESLRFDSVELVDGQGYYEVSLTDILCLSKEELIEAIVQRGVAEKGKPFDLSDTATEAIDLMEDGTGVSIERNYRIEGLARLVHTVNHEIVPYLDTEDDKHRIYSLFTIFQVSPERIRDIAPVWDAHENGDKPDLAPDKGVGPYKYVIAQDLLDRYYTGDSTQDICRRFTEDILEVLEAEYSAWETFRDDQVGAVETELRAHIAHTLDINGTRLHAVGDAAPPVLDEFMLTDTNDCGVCGRQTQNEQTLDLPLIEEKDFDEDIYLDGEELTIGGIRCHHAVCCACQLDLSIRMDNDAWRSDDDDDAASTTGETLYVYPRPNYTYSPLSWSVFQLIMERFNNIAAHQGNRFPDGVFQQDQLEWYDEILAQLQHSENEKDMVTNFENAFARQVGLGGDGMLYRLPTETGADGLLMSVFATVAAAAYSGLGVTITTRPAITTTPRAGKELVQLGPGLDSVFPFFSGNSIPLEDVEDRLKTVAAIKQLTAAADEEKRPVSTYKHRAASEMLPGAALLCAGTESSDTVAAACQYADRAAYLDTQATSGHTFARDICRHAHALGETAADIFTEADMTVGTLNTFLQKTFDVIAADGVVASPDHLRDRIVTVLRTDDSLPELGGTPSEAVHAYADRLVTDIFNDVTNCQRQQFARLTPLLQQGAVVGFLTAHRSQTTAME